MRSKTRPINWANYPPKHPKINWYFLYSIKAMSKKIMIDIQSSYYLHLSEGPGIVITSIIFNWKNYELWQQAVRTTLESKKKWGFIDGTLKKGDLKEGDDQTKLNAWEMANLMICSWIINVINPKLYPSIAYIETAASMRDNLRKRYATTKSP